MQRKQNKYDTWGNNQKLHKSFINTIKPWTLNGDSVAVVLTCDSWHSRLDACMSNVCFLFSFSRSRTAQVTHAIFGWLQHWRENYNDLRLNFQQQKGKWRGPGGVGRGVMGRNDKQHQLSADNCASMSTLQMGHFLLVRSHWSTHSWWKRCIQGRRLVRKHERWEGAVKTQQTVLTTYVHDWHGR